MRIGFFTTDFPYKSPFCDTVPAGGDYIRGGVGEVTYQLVRELAKRDHEILIFTTSADHEDHHEMVGNISLFRFGKSAKIAETEISPRFLRMSGDHGLEIVHLQAGSPPATMAALHYLKGKHVPFVLTHHLDPDYISKKALRNVLLKHYAKHYLERAFDRSDRIIALSEEFAQHSVYLPRYQDKLVFIPNGVNIGDFQTDLSKDACRKKLDLPVHGKVILFFGNVIERKGAHILIQALPEILQSVPDTTLVIAGVCGPYCQDLKARCKTMGLEPQVRFIGAVDQEERRLIFNAADMFSLPSFAESFGLVLLEAYAARLPIVVSDLPVFQKLLKEGESGLFAKTGDEKDFADKIAQLLTQEDIRTQMGERGYEIAQQYSWEKIAERTEQVYRELL